MPTTLEHLQEYWLSCQHHKSKRPYQGVNPLLLELHARKYGFHSRWWSHGREPPFSANQGAILVKFCEKRFRPTNCLSQETTQALARQGLVSEAVGARTPGLRIKSPLLYQLSYSLRLFPINDLRRTRDCRCSQILPTSHPSGGRRLPRVEDIGRPCPSEGPYVIPSGGVTGFMSY